MAIFTRFQAVTTT